MPKVTINDRTVEVPAGTNLVEAGLLVGVQIPHYCYHPRLSVVGQCRMCLVEIEVGGKKMPKLQAGCSTQVERDGMVVRTDTPEVKEAQKGMMEFLLINHPLDCPICDQAGECGLQDYSFKHGVAFSRFQFEDKRTYPGRERIPLGANVVLNMNRCIQCTRCVRFTNEIAKTGELGFFNRGARTEIGTFPGRELSNPLATCVVDVCPVGALTSTRFRFAERVFYLDKKPSICTGCEVGCNITIEHRRGSIKRYKPRANPEVNDYWMCDFGRASFERYKTIPRLATARLRNAEGRAVPATWQEALDTAHAKLSAAGAEGGSVAVLGSGFLTCEEALLFAELADQVSGAERAVAVEMGPEWHIPNLKGGITGREAAPNRRGAELAGL
ncbi:MAG TPA: 2Fe-2S iron-sulfur cluster-binding protein, partial [Thermoanaerobaculia bacterium]|nr:2Fe-2S iron-sulfur cluster-binding protein [Thermoanaerobaculia bacterium]